MARSPSNLERLRYLVRDHAAIFTGKAGRFEPYASIICDGYSVRHGNEEGGIIVADRIRTHRQAAFLCDLLNFASALVRQSQKPVKRKCAKAQSPSGFSSSLTINDHAAE
jgi:hypothetical protein